MPDDVLFAGDALISLQEVLDRIREDAGLSEAKRRELVSALNRLSKWFGVPLSALPASPRGLRQRFRDFHPAQAGISFKRMQNVRSVVRFVLKRYAGVQTCTRRDLSPACQLLYEQLADKYRRCTLRPFLFYLSELEIDPSRVTDAISSYYLAYLDENGIKDPREAHKNLCRVWNQMVDAVPGWPPVRLTVPCYREAWAFPWSDFPTSFQATVDAFLSRETAADIFAEGADFPLAPRTIATQKDHFRCLASALVRSGVAIERITSPAILVELANYTAALRWMIAHRGGKPNSYILATAYTLRKYAKYGGTLGVGERDAILKAYAQLSRHVPKGSSKTARERLKQFDNRDACRRLLTYATRTIAAALAHDDESVATALKVQGAVILELWLFAPLRLSNFAGLHLEDHLSWPMGDRPGPLLISVPGEEIKNREDQDFEIPVEVAQRVRIYLDDFRPRLAKGINPYLFPGERGPKHIDSLRDQLQNTAWNELGLKINPHLIRRLAAKLFLERHPELREIIRHVLGHRSMRSTGIYTGAERRAALRVFHTDLLRLLHKSLDDDDEED